MKKSVFTLLMIFSIQSWAGEFSGSGLGGGNSDPIRSELDLSINQIEMIMASSRNKINEENLKKIDSLIELMKKNPQLNQSQALSSLEQLKILLNLTASKAQEYDKEKLNKINVAFVFFMSITYRDVINLYIDDQNTINKVNNYDRILGIDGFLPKNSETDHYIEKNKNFLVEMMNLKRILYLIQDSRNEVLEDFSLLLVKNIIERHPQKNIQTLLSLFNQFNNNKDVAFIIDEQANTLIYNDYNKFIQENSL